MKIGVQLYTLRNVKDFYLPDILKQVKQLGYEGVEFAGFHNLEAKRLKEILSELKLHVLASHTAFEQLENNLEDVINYNRVIGNKNIVIPYTDIRDLSSYLTIMPKIKQITKKLVKQGFNVYYHNHAHEFARFNNEYLLDKLLNEIPELKLELDIYWAFLAQVDVVEYLHKQKHRIDFVHVKDMVIEQKEKFFASIGEGIIDYKQIAKKGNVCEWWIVENDRTRDDAFENIENSLKYINQIKKELN